MYYRRYQRMNNPRFVGPIFLLLGIIFGLLAAVLALNSQQFLVGTVTTTGKIIRCANGNGAESACKPVVRFTTPSGQTVIFTSTFSSSTFSQGEELVVCYHPDDPANARIGTFFALWFLPVLFLCFFLVFSLLGTVITLVFRVWQSRKVAALLN
jgi:Protein of unknown function (DUF3592).